MKIMEYQISMPNSHGVYEFDWSNGHAVIHHGSWGVTEVAGRPKNGIKESRATEFNQLPKTIQDYANKFLEFNTNKDAKR